MGADRSCVRYRARRPDDAALRVRLKALAAERRRFGYRRLYLLLLRREGQLVNKKRVHRIYREEKRRSTKLRNTVTMGVTATKDLCGGKLGGRSAALAASE